MRQINTIIDENGEEFEVADKYCRDNKLDKTALPKDLSTFNNDKDFIDKNVENLENYYKKDETYTKDETDGLIQELAEGGENANKELLQGLDAIKGDLKNFYTKAETYSQEEIDELLSKRLTFKVVSELPADDIVLSTIYLVRKGSGGGKASDKYDEYIYSDGEWELIGDTDIDLSNYYTKDETDGLIQELAEGGDSANQELIQGLNALKDNLGKEVSDRKTADEGLGARLDDVESSLSAVGGTANNNKERLDELLETSDEYVDEETGETVVEPAGERSLEVMLKKATSEAIAKIVADAPESLDTLKEISDWIASHADDASAMNTQIGKNKTDIASLTTAYESAVAALQGTIESLTNRVSALEGQLNGITFEIA